MYCLTLNFGGWNWKAGALLFVFEHIGDIVL